MPKPSISSELLAAYLAGTCTADERKQVEVWYASLPGEANFLDTLPNAEQEHLKANTLHQIQQRISQTAPPNTFQRWFHRSPSVPLAIAAAAVLLLLGFGTYFMSRPVGRQWLTGISPSTNEPKRTGPVALWQQFTNQSARLVQHRLPDGTQVWLHPQAMLRYPTSFAADKRTVLLTGEGFFDVTRDSARPFLITCGTMQVRVLGTSFNVKAMPSQAVYEVSVVTGTVAVSERNTRQASARHTVLLKPNQQLLFSVATNRLTVHEMPVKVAKELYQPISIAFSDTPIGEVARQLARRFNIRVKLVSPALQTCRLTADFDRQSLPEILELLCASVDATYSLSGDTVLIDGPGCQ